MSVKISAIVRADCAGLGTLSRMFSDYLGFHRTISIARHDGDAYHQWYSNNRICTNGVTPELARWVCDGADVLLSFETWYNGDVATRVARQMGVKTVLVPMYECCPMGGAALEQTDLVICPHALCLQEMKATPALRRAAKTLLPVPIDATRIPYRLRKQALTFLHFAGAAGSQDRNNTAKVIEAWRGVQGDAKLIIRHHGRLAPIRDERIRCEQSRLENYWDGYAEGDVLLHPHRWDGCSLPMHEALAAGLPVVTTRYWPFCDAPESDAHRDFPGWLPASSQALAIDPTHRTELSICRRIVAHETRPEAIAAAVNRLAGADIAAASEDARRFAEQHSWQRMGAHWREALRQITTGEPVPEIWPDPEPIEVLGIINAKTKH